MANNDRNVTLRALIERMHAAAVDARRALGGKGVDWFRDMSSLKCEATLVTREDENDRHLMPFGMISGRDYKAIAEHFSWCSPNNVIALMEYLGQLEVQLSLQQMTKDEGQQANNPE